MNMPEILQGDSPVRLFQGAVAGAALSMVIGFGWAGWTLGGTTAKMVDEASRTAVITALAPICVDKFQHSAEAGANLDALKKADSWKRDEMIEKAGWTKFPGSEPDRKVAEACANMLSQVK